MLSFAALLVAARPGSRGEWLAAGLSGLAGIALLFGPLTGLLDALGRAWVVLVTVAFVASAKLRPARFWPLALRSCLYTAAAVIVLGPVVAGSAVWREVQWEVTRDTSRVVRYVVELAPGLYPAFEPAVRLFAAWPLWLVLETVAGLALAWWAHALVARTPLSRVAVMNH
jgi:hypothetical protein